MPPLASVILWLAAFGVCLIVLKLKWGVWLILPAGLLYVVWPALKVVAPLLPPWAVALVVIAAPIMIIILVLRGGGAILGGVFGRDRAARVVADAIASLFRSVVGAPGRAKPATVPPPALPRPSDPHLTFADLASRYAEDPADEDPDPAPERFS
jgi:hypothetical protein